MANTAPTIFAAIKEGSHIPDTEKWYYAETAGGHEITFGKYAGKLVREVPLNYLTWALKDLQWHEDFKKCAQRFYEGLEQNIPTYYKHLVIPFSGKHSGKTIEECDDLGWMEWVLGQDHLVRKEPLVCKAIVEYVKNNPRQYDMCLPFFGYWDLYDMVDSDQGDGDDLAEYGLDEGDFEEHEADEYYDGENDEEEEENERGEEHDAGDEDDVKSESEDGTIPPGPPETPLKALRSNNPDSPYTACGSVGKLTPKTSPLKRERSGGDDSEDSGAEESSPTKRRRGVVPFKQEDED